MLQTKVSFTKMYIFTQIDNIGVSSEFSGAEKEREFVHR